MRKGIQPRGFGLALAFSILSAPGLVAGEVVTWRGDAAGTGICPGVNRLPAEFSLAKNLVWQARLPGVGHSSPIVAGGKVLVMVDGKKTLQAPHLLCFDGDTGKELWRAAVDLVDTLPEGLRDEARQRRAREWERLYRWSQHRVRVEASKADRSLGKDAAEPESAAAGVPVLRGLSGFMPNRKFIKAGQKEEDVANFEWLQQHGLVLYETSFKDLFYTQVFPAPVSDGVDVVAVSGQGVMVCVNLADGARKWIVNLHEGKVQYGGQLHSVLGNTPLVNSPLLVDGTVVLGWEFGNQALGVDRATGKVRWRVPRPILEGPAPHRQFLGLGMISSFVALRLGGAAYVLDSNGNVLRAGDGVALPRLRDHDGGELYGVPTAMVAGDLAVVPIGDAGNAARKDQGLRVFRLALAGDQLSATCVWKNLEGHSLNSPLLWKDTLYANGGGPQGATIREFDLAGGAVSATATGGAGNQQYGSQLSLIGSATPEGAVLVQTGVFMPSATTGMANGGALFTLYALPGLKPVGTGRVELPAMDQAIQEHYLEHGGQRRWGYAAPFIANNRLYVRNNEALYCFGER